MTSEFLDFDHDSFKDFGKLTSAIKNLFELKVLNDISQEVIENLIIKELRKLILEDYDEPYNFPNDSVDFFRAPYKFDFHRIYDERDIKNYLLFLSFSSNNFSFKFREKLVDIYVDYFNLEAPFFQANLFLNNRVLI
jgi:hypothetical protein